MVNNKKKKARATRRGRAEPVLPAPDTSVAREAARERLEALEGRCRAPPEWEAAGGGARCEAGAELAVMGWDLEWFEASLRRRAVRLLWQEHRLVSSRQYRDWVKLLAQMRRLDCGGAAAPEFPAYVETDPEREYPMEMVPAIAAEVDAGVERWDQKGSAVWSAYASMFETWTRELWVRHTAQWERLLRRIELEE